jgi:type IV secretory pathway VirB10-like protein
MWPNGTAIDFVRVPALDLAGQADLADRLHQRYGRLLKPVLIGGVLQAGAQVTQQEATGGGINAGGQVASGVA